MSDSPAWEIRQVVQDSEDPGYVNRLLVGTAVTGLVRIEWVGARFGQLVPCNWSMVEMRQMLGSHYALHFQVADAQNLIVKQAVQGNFEWLFLLEHDNVIPNNTFIVLNEYMRQAKYPVVSGLYFTKGYPSEPILYRGRGNSFYGDWKLGEMVMCDGVPTGCLLIHMSILRAMWDDAEEYLIVTKRDHNGVPTAGETTRRVFDTPRRGWFDEATGQFNTTSGTSDLDWCERVIAGDYLRKAGWGKFADEHPKYPFLVDTKNLFCKHIAPDGTQYPLEVTAWR